MTEPDRRDGGLAQRLVAWMAANRAALDALMVEEASRARHLEFIRAESGGLPDRAARLEAAREASSPAWLRHLGRGLSIEWPAAPRELAGRLETAAGGDPERLEALVLEERAAAERRGRSGDPDADLRDAELRARCRLFAESVGGVVDGDAPGLGRRVGAWLAEHADERRADEAAALEAWRPPPGVEADHARAGEAAAVWAHVVALARALERHLPGGPAPETP
jgi:hypothetical protein